MRPETAIFANAPDWSSPSVCPFRSGRAAMRSTVESRTVGPVVVRARSRRRSSAANSTSEENTVECFGRNTLVPSGRWNTVGLVASSGGVSRSDAPSAASTTRPTIASRSSTVANL